jgi:NhaP-type Na+/H+ or K+/H+ antiporter
MATIVFVLVALEELYVNGGDHRISFAEAIDLTGSALFTILVSVFAHGLTALPLANYMARYSRHHHKWDPANAHIRTRHHLRERLPAASHAPVVNTVEAKDEAL